MASFGWQGNKEFPFSNPDLKCNLYITSISHIGTNLRVIGKIGAVCPHGSSWYAFYVYPVYVTPGNGSRQTLLAANERVYGDTNGDGLSSAKTVDFDVTLTGVSSSTTSYNFPVSISMNNGTASGVLTWNITFDESGGPTGLSISNISSTENTVTATVSITDWGPNGDATTRYRNLSVLETADKITSARRYQRAYGNTLSSAITVDNNTQYGTLTLVPNTQYWLWWHATDGTTGSSSPDYSTTTIATKPPVPSGSISSITPTQATLNYSIATNGGKYAYKLYYTLDNGSNWTVLKSWDAGTTAAQSGSASIFNLTANTSYAVKIKTSSTAGDSINNTAITALTPAPVPSGSITATTANSISFSYAVGSHGGAHSLDLRYRVLQGSVVVTSWTTIASNIPVTGASGTQTISSLSVNTTYTIELRVYDSTSGAYSGDTKTLSVTTLATGKFYASVNGQTKRVAKLYASVNGKTKRVTKLYASIDGKTKLILQA